MRRVIISVAILILALGMAVVGWSLAGNPPLLAKLLIILGNNFIGAAIVWGLWSKR